MVESKLFDIVYDVLKKEPTSRRNDFVLVAEVYKVYGFEKLTLEEIASLEEFHPSFASIIRVRRWVQEAYPELKDKKAIIIRYAEEEDFKSLNDYIKYFK